MLTHTDIPYNEVMFHTFATKCEKRGRHSNTIPLLLYCTLIEYNNPQLGIESVL